MVEQESEGRANPKPSTGSPGDETPKSQPGRPAAEYESNGHKTDQRVNDLEQQNNELRRTQALLENARRRCTELYDLAPIGYLTFDASGLILEANLTIARQLGIEREQLVDCSFFPYVKREDRDLLYLHLRELFKSKTHHACELRLLTRQGDELQALLESTLLERPDGSLTCPTSVVDITERKRVEESLLKMEDELLKARKYESLGPLAAGIGHDFNNLLTGILGSITLAKMLVEPDDEIFDKLLEAEKASLRARDLTQQLIAFSRGGAPLKAMATIGELIRDSASFAISGTNVRCDFDIAADLWPAEVDEGQMSQVIHNLVINAQQAMPRGGRIVVEAKNITILPGEHPQLNHGRYIRISVADEGRGIPPENLAKIFDPYFTTKEKGSGLGLAIAASIVKRHGGTITVQSEPGRGTSFDVSLPASEDRFEKKPLAEAPLTGRGRVLIMDDEALVREVAGKMLERLGYEVEAAANGREALMIYKQAIDSGQPLDLVILDLTVPGGMGGEETLRHLQELDPDVRAIVTSGYTNDPRMVDFRKYGFQEAVVKPFHLQELARKIGRAHV